MAQLVIDDEGPAARLARVRTERQTFVAQQFIWALGDARSLQVGRRGHAEPPVIRQSHADQARIGQVAHTHGAVEAFVDDVDNAVRQVQRHADVGMQGDELRHQWRHVAATETRWNCET